MDFNKGKNYASLDLYGTVYALIRGYPWSCKRKSAGCLSREHSFAGNFAATAPFMHNISGTRARRRFLPLLRFRASLLGSSLNFSDSPRYTLRCIEREILRSRINAGDTCYLARERLSSLAFLPAFVTFHAQFVGVRLFTAILW